MTPDQTIKSLERQLKQHGLTVRLQRLSKGSPQTVEQEVVLRGFDTISSEMRKSELVNAVSQNDKYIILSGKEITDSGFDSGAIGSTDKRIPIKGNKAFFGGRLRNIEAASYKYMNDVLVRVEIQTRG
jgi:hypothetical protein